jgi:hypothetical protein
MKLNKLSLKDKQIFIKYLGLVQHDLSTYVFENIYIWRRLFCIEWAIIEDNLCIFFKDKIGVFLYITPLGKNKNPETVGKCFKIMDRFNRNKDISRIENIESGDLSFYQGIGYDCKIKSYDYLCLRSSLSGLQGNQFKSQRACFNYFTKHYDFEYLPFTLRHRDDCLKLYDNWAGVRKAQNPDHLYQGMLKDSRICLKIALESYSALDLLGRVVKINKEIRGFTFGFKLNTDTFCILYEITDLSIKGLAQFIFREFSQELTAYKYINIMDDSGLENLKKVKLSYHPVKLIPAYITNRRT